MIVYNRDSVIAITKDQERLINLMHINLKQCSEINDSLLVKIDSCIQGFNTADSAIKSLQIQIHSYQVFQQQQLSVIDTLHSVVHDQKHIINKLKFRSLLSHVGEGVLGVIIIWLFLQK